MQNKTLKIVLAIAFFLLIIIPVFLQSTRSNDIRPLVKKTGEPGRFIFHFETMGTDASVIVYAEDTGRAAEFIEPAVKAIEKVNRLMSFYRPDSDISTINRAGPGVAVKVSGHTYNVIEQSIYFSDLTDGAFDITFTPLKKIWQQARENGREPAGELIEETLGRIGSDKIELVEDGKVKLLAEGMLIDLGGIAKGYAADLAVAELKKAGCKSALVNIGGDMAALGRRGDGERWQILVRDPRNGSESTARLAVDNTSLATSGDYARYFTINGKRYSHIMDPRTGRPAENVPSATLIAPDALTADALSTALSVMEPAAGVSLVNSLDGVESMIMERRREGEKVEFKFYYSDGFKNMMAG